MNNNKAKHLIKRFRETAKLHEDEAKLIAKRGKMKFRKDIDYHMDKAFKLRVGAEIVKQRQRSMKLRKMM